VLEQFLRIAQRFRIAQPCDVRCGDVRVLRRERGAVRDLDRGACSSTRRSSPFTIAFAPAGHA
jgi:hypothetical protein